MVEIDSRLAHCPHKHWHSALKFEAQSLFREPHVACLLVILQLDVHLAIYLANEAVLLSGDGIVRCVTVCLLLLVVKHSGKNPGVILYELRSFKTGVMSAVIVPCQGSDRLKPCW